MRDDVEPTVRLFSYTDDQPTERIGVLIPRSNTAAAQQNKPTRSPLIIRVRKVVKITLVPVMGLAAVLLLLSGYDLLTAQNNLAAAPTVMIYDPYSQSQIPLTYGPEATLAQSSFFNETRSAFIEEGLNFIEIDLDTNMLRYFKEGVLLQNKEIIATPEAGSWWDVPSGLYKVEAKEERLFSNYTQTYFPWHITFEGNYAIHGYPEYPDGTEVDEDFKGGGVRLSNDSAKALFEVVKPGTSVLVHKTPKQPDNFVYEPVGPAVTAKHYLVADLENGTILAASDLHESVPIASLTKLMTAIVAAEEMSFEQRVRTTTPTFVESLIPRLAGRNSVSMYSLMQLLLVESSNEAAEVIAGWYGRDEFITKMNDTARTLGLFDTTFADPSGLSAENVSSLSDLYKLARYIHSHRQFIFEISATGQAVGVPGGGEFTNLVNFNQVENLDNFVGGKIGETMAAGQTSLSLHEVTVQGDTRTIAVILLGSEARDEDVQQLVSFVGSHYTED